MAETETESTMDNNNDKKETTVALLTSEAKVLSIGNRREYFKLKKPVATFDTQILMDECKKRFGQLLLGNRTPFVPNNHFMMDLFTMQTVEEDNQPRRYHFQSNYCVSPGNTMHYGVFGQTLYADAVMHELKRRLKNHKWISKNILEFPIAKIPGGSHYSSDDDYYVQNMVHDILHEQRDKICRFLVYLQKDYRNERLKSKKL